MSFSTKTIGQIYRFAPLAVCAICCVMLVAAFKSGAFALAAFFGVIMLQALGFAVMLFVSSMRAAWNSIYTGRG